MLASHASDSALNRHTARHADRRRLLLTWDDAGVADLEPAGPRPSVLADECPLDHPRATFAGDLSWLHRS